MLLKPGDRVLSLDLAAGGHLSHGAPPDLSAQGLTGQQVQNALARVNITSNKNPVPFDSARPSEWAGLRLGVAAITTRGFRELQMIELGNIIATTINACQAGDIERQLDSHRQQVAALCQQFSL